MFSVREMSDDRFMAFYFTFFIAHFFFQGHDEFFLAVGVVSTYWEMEERAFLKWEKVTSTRGLF